MIEVSDAIGEAVASVGKKENPAKAQDKMIVAGFIQKYFSDSKSRESRDAEWGRYLYVNLIYTSG